MSDARTLRNHAVAWLRDQWPEAVIIPELSVASWGGARLDVAAVTPTELIGVEIKGEGDSTARLALQGMQYGAVCTRLFLLPCDSLRDKCVNAKPPGWLMARNKSGDWWINKGDDDPWGNRGHGYDGKTLPTSPARLVEMLWAPEVKMLGDIHRIHVPGGQKMGYEGRAAHIAREVPLTQLQPAVYWLIHRRKWESARMPKTVWRPDDGIAV